MKDQVFDIDGFVRNDGRDAHFKLQRPLPPGAKLTFAQAFATVGARSEKKGREFVEWLRENHFSGGDWGFYSASGQPFFTETEAASLEARPSGKVAVGEASPGISAGKGAGKALRRRSTAAKVKGIEITAVSMVEPNYAEAKTLIDACKSRRELKKALTLSKNLSHKEDHMRHIHARLQQV